MTADPYRYFRIEARELIDQLAKAVLDLEKGTEPGLIARLLRLAHTLKGAARVVRQAEIADHTHAIEEVLAPFRETTLPVPRERIEALLGLLDRISEWTSKLALPPDPAGTLPGKLPSDAPSMIHARGAEMDELLYGIVEMRAQLGVLRKNLVLTEKAERLVDLLADQAAPVPAQVSGPLTEELKLLTGTIGRTLGSGFEQIERELAQVRDAAERLRLVPVGSLFTTLERAARDAAQALGKRVEFVGRGGDVRIEAQALTTIQDALMQVVRNAVAHGIESESERTTAGKLPAGQIAIEAVRRGRHIVFVGTDDGRGVDLEAVRQVMLRKGGFPADIQRLSSEELLRMLLRGGISTSGAVTEVSGRGIGLDIVRAAAARLGGEASLRTTAGKGTQVELTVPLSLTMIDVLIVEAAGLPLSIPRAQVRQTVRIAMSDLVRTGDGETTLYQGRAVPFAPATRVVTGRPPSSRGSRPWSAVVLESGDAVAVLGVDRLLGTTSVVLQPLPPLAPSAAVVIGAWMDAEGNPQLVLDPEALIAEAGRCPNPEPHQETPRIRVLIVDDSLTTRMLERSILESAGYDVDTATSGEEALEKARGNRYALFLIDVEMPGMDGFTVIERLRADPTQGGIPSILVTSRASAEDRRRGEQVGADAYIVKSEFDQDLLLARIRGLVK